MKERTNAEQKKPEEFTEDPLTEVLRQGACKLLAQAVEDEVTGFLAAQTAVRDAQGRQMIVRNGHVPARQIQTGMGAVTVQAPRVRDRRKVPPADRIPLTSTILPRYLRRTKRLDELIPWLSLKGISTGDFSEA